METKDYRIKVVLLTELLGSQSQGEVASAYMAKRAGFETLPEDEVETIGDAVSQGTTVFHRDGAGNPLMYDYQLKGFLKNAAQVLNGKVTGNVKNLKSKVNNTVFVLPRSFRLNLPNGDEMQYCERPLRAMTARGERVALARSEMLPAGTWFQAQLTVLPGEVSRAVLEDLLDYGYYQGLGQWRNGGYGRFRYELEAED